MENDGQVKPIERQSEGMGIAQRISWIDTAKGIGILLVVLGHVDHIPVWLHSLIYSFHMPMFFLLSGIIFHSGGGTLREQFVKCSRAYLLPYIVLSGCNLILQSIWLLYTHAFSWRQVMRYIAGILYGYANIYWMPNCSPLWFLPCIFLCKMGLLVITKKSRKVQAITILCCIAVSYGAYILRLPRLPWNLWTAFMGAAFMWIGYLLKDFISEKRYTWVRVAVGLVTLGMLRVILANAEQVGMNENTYGNLAIFFVGALGGSLILLRIAMSIPQCWFLTNLMGRHTILILAFNYWARTVSTELYYMVPFFRTIPLNWPVSFVATMLLLIMIALAETKLIRNKSCLHRRFGT